MKKLSIITLPLLLSSSLLFSSCQNTNPSKDVDAKGLTEKENELLKKENELLKKEKELSLKNDKSSTSQPDVSSQSSDLNFLLPFNKKYGFEVELLDHPVLESRLEKLLGASEWEFLQDIWQVETPIEIENNMFYAWAMEKHSAGDPSAVIMADISKNILYVGIRKDGKVKFYTENNSPVPQRLKKWAEE